MYVREILPETLATGSSVQLIRVQIYYSDDVTQYIHLNLPERLNVTINITCVRMYAVHFRVNPLSRFPRESVRMRHHIFRQRTLERNAGPRCEPPFTIGCRRIVLDITLLSASWSQRMVESVHLSVRMSRISWNAHAYLQPVNYSENKELNG